MTNPIINQTEKDIGKDKPIFLSQKRKKTMEEMALNTKD